MKLCSDIGPSTPLLRKPNTFYGARDPRISANPLMEAARYAGVPLITFAASVGERKDVHTLEKPWNILVEQAYVFALISRQPVLTTDIHQELIEP